MDVAAFSARLAIVRSVLYSIAVMRRPRRRSALNSRLPIRTFPGGPSREPVTESCMNTSAPTRAASGTSLSTTSTCWRTRCGSRSTTLRPRPDRKTEPARPNRNRASMRRHTILPPNRHPPACRAEGGPVVSYAARTSAMKLPTSLLSCSAWRDRSFAAPSTWPDASLVSVAASRTPSIFAVTASVA
jgi:hypothetical protein